VKVLKIAKKGKLLAVELLKISRNFLVRERLEFFGGQGSLRTL
jgi:hypothetical protein